MYVRLVLREKTMKMREMIRCLLCGRMAWPTMLARGQQGQHRLDKLRLVCGRGRGKGIKWARTDLTNDPTWLRMFVDTLKSLLEILEKRLEDLGEGADGEDLKEVEPVSVVEKPPILLAPPTIIKPTIVTKVPILRR